MTQNEFSRLSAIMATAYSKEHLFLTDESVKLWFSLLKDLEYRDVHTFLEKWICSNEWSPTISDIRKGVAELAEPQVADWQDEWIRVVKAAEHFGANNPTKALATLSPAAAEAVRSLGWKHICLSETPDIVRGQFRQVYEAKAKRANENRHLPAKLRNILSERRDSNALQLSDTGNAGNQKELPAHGDHQG